MKRVSSCSAEEEKKKSGYTRGKELYLEEICRHPGSKVFSSPFFCAVHFKVLHESLACISGVAAARSTLVGVPPAQVPFCSADPVVGVVVHTEAREREEREERGV